MRRIDRHALLVVAALASIGFARAGEAQPIDPLPSWNDGRAEAGDRRVRRRGSRRRAAPDFVPVPERIATFDNDGTLWAEQPIYFQFAFALDRVKALAPQHPEWKDTAAVQGGARGRPRRRSPHPARRACSQIMAATHTGMTTDEFADDRHRLDRHRAPSAVRAALHRARLPADARAARLSARQRLQDLHRLRRRRRVHARRWPSRSTASRPSRWSARQGVVKFEMEPDGKPVLMQGGPRSSSSTTAPASPSASTASSAAARSSPSATPTAICRCCNGPRRATGRASGPIVHHTDAEREWAYDRDSHIGKLDKALDEANAKGWTVVDMKDDWETIFAEAPK